MRSFAHSLSRSVSSIGLLGALLGCARESLPATESDPVLAANAPDGRVPPADASATLDGGVVAVGASTPDAGSFSSDAGKPANADAARDAAPIDTVPDTGSPPPSSMPPPAGTNLCHLAGNQVAVLGDSYMALSGDFTRMLQELARKNGALGADDTYVERAQLGAQVLSSPSIPAQLPAAVADAKRRGSKGLVAMIMTGGGNDVLINERSCLEKASVDDVSKDAVCSKLVDDVIAAMQKLVDDAVAQGVQAIIYFFYPHLPKDAPLGGLIKGSHPNSMIDYAAPRAQAFCGRQSAIPCHFIDMRPPFEDPASPGWPRGGLIGFDGVHPTAAGSQILANEVWARMQITCFASQ